MAKTLGEHEIAAVIDTEHIEIHARLNLFRDRVLQGDLPDNLRAALDEIHDIIVTHFRTEEVAMQRLRYGNLWEHRDEHLVIWHSFLRAIDGCYTNGFHPECGERVYATMQGLLDRHAERHDRPFLEYVRKRIRIGR